MTHAATKSGPSDGPDPAAPPPESDSEIPRGRLIVIFVGLILGILMAALDQTIVAAALPHIAADLNGLKSISWIITSYLLAQTISMPLYGKVGDFIGRRNAFHLAIFIFLAGSVFAGLAQSMGMLITFRAVQGIGAGGLMIGAQTIMAEIVSARERGKYMSVMGPMIGVATVLGPLLGGFLTQHISWRWIFYINVPIGIAAFVVTAVALKLPKPQRDKSKVDYLGAILMALSAAALVLLLNWGGSRFDWISVPIFLLAAAVLVLVPAWLYVESRAENPIMPLHLFRDGVFRINVPMAFMVGVAMFGAVSYLPTYLQLSLGVSATWSGILMLPLMGGLMAAAVVTGQVISRTGRYKPFPILGAGIAAVGMFLLSLLDASASRGESSLYMVILGMGIGFIMPTLVLTTQNSVAREDISSATAGVNFFRQIGASFGVAVIGSLFTSRLTEELAENLPANATPGGAAEVQGLTSEQLEQLPPDVAQGIVVSYADALMPLYLYLVPLLLIAFVLAWILPEKRLATATGATASDDPEDPEQAGTGQPDSEGSEVDSAVRNGTPGSSVDEDGRTDGASTHGDGMPHRTPALVGADDRATPAGQWLSHEHRGGGHAVSNGSATARMSPAGQWRSSGSVQPEPDRTGTAEAALVRGTVSRPDGTGLAGVALTLTDASGRQVGRGGTGADGGYQLDVPAPGTYVLIASAAGHQPRASQVLVGSEPSTLDVTLTGAATLVGTVTTTGHWPLPNARVILTDSTGEVAETATTGEDGFYRFGALLSDAYTLVVSEPEHQPTAEPVEVAAAGETRRDIVLAAAAALVGNIRAAATGEPLRDARVSLLDNAGNQVAITETDAAGRYRLPGLSAGDYTVIATGYPPVVDTVHITGEGACEYDVDLGHSTS